MTYYQRKITSISLALAAMASLMGGCAGPEADLPFTILVRSQDVTLAAVQRMTIEIDPEPLRFEVMDTESFMQGGGTVDTHVSAVGEWVLSADAAWVQANATVNPGQGVFEIPVPVWTEERVGEDVETHSPTIQVRFYREDMQITDDTTSAGYLTYPAPPGNQVLVRVNCRLPDHASSCANEDSI